MENEDKNKAEYISIIKEEVELEKYTYYKNIKYKKNWSQRLRWFETKIISNLKNMNKNNILVVGDNEFYDTLNKLINKHEWNCKLSFANIPISIINSYDLIIDTNYESIYFNIIYCNPKIVISFQDIYKKILFEEAFKFLKANNIKFFCFIGPDKKRIKNLSEIDKTFLNLEVNVLMDKYNDKVLELLYHDNSECHEYIEKRIDSKKIKYNNGKYVVLANLNEGELYQSYGGNRRTCFHKYEGKNVPKIHMYGPCIVHGTYVSDSYTIPSLIQKKLNEEEFIGNVINYGIASDIINDFEKLIDTEFKLGDIVIHISIKDKILDEVFKHLEIQKYDMTSLFDRPHNYGNWMINSGGHVNHNGNKAMSDYIFNIIKPYLSKSFSNAELVKYKLEDNVEYLLENNLELKEYIEMLKEIRQRNNIKGKCGTMLMNCNPFTLGHRYLIEEACKEVDHLYVFILQYNKSNFSPEERFELVEKGISDLGNKVEAIKGGQFVASNITLPEYSNKEEQPNAIVDCSLDMNIFTNYICPALDISIRFQGEEPKDFITRNYINQLGEELSKKGMELKIIPRKVSTNGDIISAKTVRRIIKENTPEKASELLKSYVPKTTLKFILENYEDLKKRM